MANLIGEKIKTLRKELKLTQSELAGNEMTKSMLSQIENNQASPSMKNLQYLAYRLNRPISYFLDEDNAAALPVDEINSAIRKAISLFNKFDFSGAAKLLESLLDKYTFHKNNMFYGEILYLKGKCLVHLKNFAEGENALQESFELFMSNHLYIEAAKAYLEFGERYFANFDYEKCLEILTKVEDIYHCSTKKDIIFEIDLIFSKIILHSAMGNISESLNLIHKAINIAKETEIYYKTDNSYRLAAKLYLYEGKYDDFQRYIEKATLFAKFTEDKEALAMIALQKATYDNEMNNAESALNHLKFHEENVHTLTYIYYSEKGKSYYLLKEYEKALEIFQMVDYSFYANHRLNYLELWSSKIYEGLTLHKLGKSSEALEIINFGIKKLEIFKYSKYLALAYKSLSEIYSDMGNYLEAFKALKIADGIKNGLNKD